MQINHGKENSEISSKINISDEILRFSNNLPLWQQDALRRIYDREVNIEDIEELVVLAKKENNITVEKELISKPIDRTNISFAQQATEVVKIISISGTENVNALANNQNLEFVPKGLTIVYGNNGSGKSGYSRILRRACRARKAPKIFGNVSVRNQGEPSTEIVIEKSSGESETIKWKNNQPEELSSFYVYDRECEKEYIDGKESVPYPPQGLEAFSELANIVKKVKENIYFEASNIILSDLTDLKRYEEIKNILDIVEKNISDSEFVNNTMSNIENFSFSEENQEQLYTIAQLLDSDIEDKIKQLDLLKSDLYKIYNNIIPALKGIGTLVGRKIYKIWKEREHLHIALESVKLDKIEINGQEVKTLGSPIWKELYKAAHSFAKVSSNNELIFPESNSESVCPLCFQSTNVREVKLRFENFKEFMSNTIQVQYQQKKEYYDKIIGKIELLNFLEPDFTLFERLNNEFGENDDLNKALESLNDEFEERKKQILRIKEKSDWEKLINVNYQKFNVIKETLEKLELKIKLAKDSQDPEKKAKLENTKRKLEIRKILFENRKRLYSYVEKRRLQFQLEELYKSISTRKITIDGRQLADRILTEGLKLSYERELILLGAKKEILANIRSQGDTGEIKYGIEFDGDQFQSIKMSEVLSEGEQRVVSLAYFFAEINMSKSKVGVIIDDPISSLDHRWERKIAKRIMELATERQVIVFTHNISFLLSLQNKSNRFNVPIKRQYLSKHNQFAGYCDEASAPWETLMVKDRIKMLDKRYQEVKQLNENGLHKKEYYRRTDEIVDLLRATWERVVEEIILNGVVIRFDHAVHTNQLRDVDVADDDFREVYEAMSDLSELTKAHDRAAKASIIDIEPDEIRLSIEKLRIFVSSYNRKKEETRKRRTAKTIKPQFE